MLRCAVSCSSDHLCSDSMTRRYLWLILLRCASDFSSVNPSNLFSYLSCPLHGYSRLLLCPFCLLFGHSRLWFSHSHVFSSHIHLFTSHSCVWFYHSWNLFSHYLLLFCHSCVLFSTFHLLSRLCHL